MCSVSSSSGGGVWCVGVSGRAWVDGGWWMVVDWVVKWGWFDCFRSRKKIGRVLQWEGPQIGLSITQNHERVGGCAMAIGRASTSLGRALG